MRALLALFKREFLEHRGAFLYAPVGLLVVLLAGDLLAVSGGRIRLPDAIGNRLHDAGGLLLGQLWWWYLLAALFFYYADAFSADRRNNAMLFWKSMPVGDLAMLASKMLAGLILFPVIVFAAYLVSIALLLVSLALAAILGIAPPDPGPGLAAIPQVLAFTLCHFVLGLLWYAPFFGWVGALSTVFRRWSIPLAFLIPLAVSLLENAAFYGLEPSGGYVWGYLSARLQFGLPREVWMAALFNPLPLDASLLTRVLVEGIDWVQLAGGLAVAAGFVWLASLYRRKGVSA